MKSNLVLIGMPGAGKSTIGVLLAKKLNFEFIDTDLLIQSQQNRSLQDIVDNEGYMELRKIESDALKNLNCTRSLISTGGSAVYSPEGMENLKKIGTIVFLDVSYDEIVRRIGDFSQRGIAMAKNQTFEDLYNERNKLYNQYSELTIDCNQLSQDELCGHIAQKYSEL